MVVGSVTGFAEDPQYNALVLSGKGHSVCLWPGAPQLSQF